MLGLSRSPGHVDASGELQLDVADPTVLARSSPHETLTEDADVMPAVPALAPLPRALPSSLREPSGRLPGGPRVATAPAEAAAAAAGEAAMAADGQRAAQALHEQSGSIAPVVCDSAHEPDVAGPPVAMGVALRVADVADACSAEPLSYAGHPRPASFAPTAAPGRQLGGRKPVAKVAAPEAVRIHQARSADGDLASTPEVLRTHTSTPTEGEKRADAAKICGASDKLDGRLAAADEGNGTDAYYSAAAAASARMSHSSGTAAASTERQSPLLFDNMLVPHWRAVPSFAEWCAYQDTLPRRRRFCSSTGSPLSDPSETSRSGDQSDF